MRILSLLSFLMLFSQHLYSFSLDSYGEFPIDYSKYGTFESTGTDNYRYVINDRSGLALAAGSGVFPDVSAVSSDRKRELFALHPASKSHWDYLNSPDYETAFYKWVDAPESQGVKLFYRAEIMKKAAISGETVDLDLLKQSIKAYYALIVHFPNTLAYTFWQTPWYPAVVAVDNLYYLTRKFPQLGFKYQNGWIDVQNGFNDKVNDDVFWVSPGSFLKPSSTSDSDLDSVKAVEKIGKGDNYLIKYSNSHWQFYHKDKPIMIQAVAYSPAPIGRSPDLGNWNTFKDWLYMDTDKNGVRDIYEIWVDSNRNDKKDKDEKTMSEFELMKEMGVNCIRMYHHGYDKEQLRKIYETTGIGFLMGDFLGMYTIGSGADWYEGTDYSNKKHKENMLASLKEMLDRFKDEDYIYMWVLGNENNYGFVGDENESGLGCMAKAQPVEYYSFVNEAAKYIKKHDPQKRPVAICNGDLINIDYFSKLCPDVDVFGVNAYRGAQGFGYSFWRTIDKMCGKPVLITEYGCPAYGKGMTLVEAEKAQADYLRGNWEDMLYNSFGNGFGSSIGGASFEWVDEWWKGGPPPKFKPDIQETVANFTGPYPDGSFYEEWLGVTSQGKGKHSPFMRQLRKAFFEYKNLWNAE